MKIYLISLVGDIDRRDSIKINFPLNYTAMKIVNAVDGKNKTAKEYFDFLSIMYLKNKNLITPSELGCTLSHIEALNLFLKSKDNQSLILEDDVMGEDKNIDLIINMSNYIPKNSILICGGQEGFDHWKYIVGKKIENNLYEIPRFSLKFIYRACCYVVDRESAQYLYNYHNKNYNVVDHWYNILKKSDVKVFYCNQLSHPLDLSQSKIEREREIFYKNGFFLSNKSRKKNFFNKVFTRLINDMTLIILLFLGYRFLKVNFNG